MNNIFNFNKPVKHTGRNGFDNSFSRVIKMRPSFCRPVKAFDTVPNSSYKINVSDLVRTTSLQTAAFLRGKQELDVYFVPYSQLYSRANDVVLSRGEDNSASIASLSGSSFPKVPLHYLFYCASAPYIFLRFVKYYQSKLNAFKEMHFFPSVTQPLYIDRLAHRFLGIAYGADHLKRAYDLFVYTKESYFPYSVDDYMSHYVQAFNDSVESAEFIGADSLQLLSTLDYGDYYLLFKDFMDTFFESPEVTQNEQQLYDSDFGGFVSAMDSILYALQNDLRGLFHYISDDQFDFLQPAFEDNKFVSLVHLAAYQKVWRDCYRDSITDDSALYLFSFSLDRDFTGIQRIGESEANEEFLLTLLRPRLRTMKRDLSNGIYSDTQFGEAPSSYNYDADALNIPDSLRPDNPGSAVSIKYVLAMQRYQQTLMRAGNRTKDLLMAEFGVKSHYIEDNYPKHVGSFDGALDLNKVTSTAESGTYSVGDLAGNVFSSLQGRELEFTCNDHGVLIFMLSFICDPLHNAFGLSPFNTKLETFDFYKEDFENLGLQPVSSSIFSPFVFDNEDGQTYTVKPKILGYSARYNEYKQQFDTVHDTFCTHMICPSLITDAHYTMSNNGVNSNYVIVRDLVQTLSNLKDRSYLMPSCMDTIFKSLDTGLPEDSHFDVALSVELKSILPMSTLGLI